MTEKIVNGKPVPMSPDDNRDLIRVRDLIAEPKRVAGIKSAVQSEIFTHVSDGKSDIEGLISQINRIANTLEIMSAVLPVDLLKADDQKFINESLLMIRWVNAVRAQGKTAVLDGVSPDQLKLIQPDEVAV